MCLKREDKEKLKNHNNLEEKKNSIKFYNLSPGEIDKDSIYLEALDQKIKDKEVFNIAIMGRYGAGKTSVIKTYENMHKEYNYLNISLASFKDNGRDNNANIERSILQQLFYSVNPFKIPNSRFKRIKNITDKEILKKICIFLLLVLMIIVSIYLLINPQYINKNVLIDNLKQVYNLYFNGENKRIVSILLFVFLFVGIEKILLLIVKRILLIIEISNIKLKKESIEIDINGKKTNSDSIFNKYIDEIIYFFEVTQYDVVAIEDLDRFENSTEVFIKLRELNKIINSCETVNKKVKFIYAVKDEKFTGNDRIKFFDFILPIIPVVNSFNSRQKLLDKLAENNMTGILNEKYIRQITLYIDDMRLLNNIMNEFNIYYINLKEKELTMENLFSIITFKNIYPEEFAKLQDGRGIVNNIFKNKNKRLETYEKKIINEKDSCEKKIKDLMNNSNVQNEYNGQLRILKKEENKINFNLNKIKEAYNMSLKEILSNFEIEDILLENEIKNGLLVFLLSNGYLQEDYQEYINYFYSGALKTNDNNFLIKLNSHQKLPYEYKLSEIKEVIESLSIKNFKQREILNFDLLDFIFEHEKEYIKQEILIIDVLCDGTETSIKFCIEYLKHLNDIKRREYIKKFILNTSKVSSYILYYLENKGTDFEKEIYIYNLLHFFNIEEIKKVENIEYLKNYIVEDSNFIRRFDGYKEIKNIKEILIYLNVKFKNIEIEDFSTDLGKFIIENDLFEVNQHMIYSILKKKYGMKFGLAHGKEYINIKEGEKLEFEKYLHNQMLLNYVESLYLEDEKNIDAQKFETLLNSSMIALDVKKYAIKKQKDKITNILDINVSIWEILLKENKVIAKWENIVQYYKKNNITPTLIEFIKNNIQTLIMDTTKISFELLKKLVDKIENEFGVLLLENQANELQEYELENIIEHILRKNTNSSKNEYKLENNNISLRLYNIIKNKKTYFSVTIIKNSNEKQYIIIRRNKDWERK